MSTDVYGDEERIEWRREIDLGIPDVVYEVVLKSGLLFSNPAKDFRAGRLVGYAVCKRNARAHVDGTGQHWRRRVWFVPRNAADLQREQAAGAVAVLTSSIRAGEPSQPATKKQTL